jgi:hypothetical protein
MTIENLKTLRRPSYIWINLAPTVKIKSLFELSGSVIFVPKSRSRNGDRIYAIDDMVSAKLQAIER